MSDITLQKMALPLLTAGLVGVAGWVWQSQTKLANLQLELSHQQGAITKLEGESNTTQVAVLERDLEHVQQQLEIIKDLVLKNSALRRSP